MDPTAPAFTTHFEPAEEEERPSRIKIPQISGDLKSKLTIAAVIVVVAILWVYITSPMIVTVTGSGEVSAPATNATISFTISSNANDPSQATKDAQGKADSMETYLQSKGFQPGDIARSQVTVVPASLVTTGATGYQASISMAAKTIDVQSLPILIPSLYGNGAFVVSQPVLSVENQNNLDQQAFDAAMNDAKTQAANVGNANWKFIRKIISISQVSSPTTSTSTTKAAATDTNASAITNGVFKIVKAVSVSYKMW